MPTYIDRTNEIVTPQPYALDRTTSYAFVVKADPTQLQAVVDRELNAPRAPAADGWHYRVLTRRVLLVIAQIGRMASANPPAAGHGWGRETDAAYWLLLGAGRTVDDVFLLDRLVWYQPYIFVDNPWAMAGGREVYGFPKQLCRATLPESPAQAQVFAIDTLVLDPFSPETEQAWKRLITLERVEPGEASSTATPTPAAAGVPELVHQLLHGDEELVIPTLHLLGSLVAMLVKKESHSVYLKQFRDVADPTAACYQAIVEAPLQITHTNGFGFLPGRWRLTQAEYASQPLASTLGLASPQETGLAFWVRFDSTIGNGQVVWQAG